MVSCKFSTGETLEFSGNTFLVEFSVEIISFSNSFVSRISGWTVSVSEIIDSGTILGTLSIEVLFSRTIDCVGDSSRVLVGVKILSNESEPIIG